MRTNFTHDFYLQPQLCYYPPSLPHACYLVMAASLP